MALDLVYRAEPPRGRVGPGSGPKSTMYGPTAELFSPCANVRREPQWRWNVPSPPGFNEHAKDTTICKGACQSRHPPRMQHPCAAVRSVHKTSALCLRSQTPPCRCGAKMCRPASNVMANPHKSSRSHIPCKYFVSTSAGLDRPGILLMHIRPRSTWS
jgi:hypothetical protein